MAQQFVKVTRQGWGSKIMNSFVGMLIGILLFCGSFVVLWMNEGRTNWASVAKASVSVDASSVSGSADGKFIAASGQLDSTEALGDSPYLQPGDYVKLVRTVEMYAWEEQSSSTTEKDIGGSSTTKTTYEYEQVWTSSPQDSSKFEYAQNHTNPTPEIKGAEFTVATAKLGVYELDTRQLALPDGQQVRLTQENASDFDGTVSENFLFTGQGTLNKPQIGDLRISYTAAANHQQATVFGQQQGSALVPYLYGSDTFYRAFFSDRNSAIAAMNSEYQMLGWILRLVGFLMMWFGIMLGFGPITSVLDFLPFLGNVAGWAIGAVSFGLSLALTVVVVIISMIAHSILAMLVLLALVGGIVAWSVLRHRGGVAAVPA